MRCLFTDSFFYALDDATRRCAPLHDDLVPGRYLGDRLDCGLKRREVDSFFGLRLQSIVST